MLYMKFDTQVEWMTIIWLLPSCRTMTRRSCKNNLQHIASHTISLPWRRLYHITCSSCKNKLDASKRFLHVLSWLLGFPWQTKSYLRPSLSMIIQVARLTCGVHRTHDPRVDHIYKPFLLQNSSFSTIARPKQLKHIVGLTTSILGAA